MPGDLSFELHALTARLDRSADRILQRELGLSYSRFRTLHSVDRLSVDTHGVSTQRAVAAELGVSEPSASRMTGVLTAAGLLEATPDPDGGHRRRLRLTPAGKDAVERCRTLLEDRFAALLDRCGVSYADYARDTRRLLTALEES